MIETNYDDDEEEFSLRADYIFNHEKDLWNEKGGGYTKEERKAIVDFCQMIENFYWENHIEEKDLPRPNDKEYRRNQQSFRLILEGRAEKPENFPVPLFFINRKQVIDYAICHDYTPDFSDKKDDFNLFLAFKLRHLSSHNIRPCLNHYQKLIGDQFLPFYDDSFPVHKYLLDENKIKIISSWIEIKKSEVNQNKENFMKSSDKEIKEPYNAAELTLLLHFFLKHLEIDPKEYKSETVKFLHIISQTTFTKYANSNFKEKVLKAPSVAKEDATINYLERIADIFREHKLEKIESLVKVALQKERNSKKEK